MRIIFFFVFFSLLTLSSQAQELRAKVTINTPLLQNTDARIFETLKNQIEEFYNNRTWTDNTYEEEERIQIDITMTISEEISATSFKADFLIQAIRPVYNSAYETSIFNHRDDNFAFQYEQFQPIEYNPNAFTSNLSALLQFYAYTILALDGDSFAPFGGEPYLTKLNDVVASIPQNISGDLRKGWASIDGNRNRYWLAENLRSPRVRPFRQAWYDYHRQALDIMAADVTSGRVIMTNAIESLGDVNRAYPNSMILQVFANTKSAEIVEIYKKGTPPEQNTVISTMSKIDASNSAKYRTIR